MEEIANKDQTNSSCGGSTDSHESDSIKERKIIIAVENINNILKSDTITVPETGECAINLSGSISMEEPTPQFIDDILANPILFTVFDRTPVVKSEEAIIEPKKDTKKESKKGSSRTSMTATVKSIASYEVLGICNMDLGSIIKGKTIIREVMRLEIDKDATGQHLITWPKLPKLSAYATTGEEPLIPPHLNESNNIINITVESVYNVPGNIEEGTMFEAKILIPNFSDVLNPVVFPDGLVTCMSDRVNVKRWLTLNHVKGRGALTKYRVNPDASDITNPYNEVPNLEKVMTIHGHRIHWNNWRSSIMVKTGANCFFRKLTDFRVWPIEIIGTPRVTRSESQKMSKGEKKQKTASTPVPAPPEHYVAYLRLGSLLYPGVTRIRVASLLHTYSPQEMVEKCGGDFVSQSKTDISGRNTKPEKDGEEIKDSRDTTLYNENGRPVYIIVEVEVWKPYLPKREPEYFFERFNSYFAPKGKISKKKMNLNFAEKNFSEVIKELSYYINNCYEEYIINGKNSGSDSLDQDTFMNYLCQNGCFQKIKESLTDKVVCLVGEKYGDISQDKDKICQVYIDLVNQIHTVTNEFTLCKPETLKKTRIEANDLQLSAEEAIEDENYELAKRYLLQKLWSNKHNPDYWLDYAIYLIMLEDYDKCVESIREALSLDMKHQMALLMYGLIMFKLNDYYVAELTLQVLLAKYPDFIEGWVILHLFYSTIGNLDGAEYTIQMAFKLENELKGNKTSDEGRETEEDSSVQLEEGIVDLAEGRYGMASFDKGRSMTDPLSWTINLGTKYSIFMRTVVLLLRLNFFEFAQSLLTRECNRERSLEFLYYISVNHYLRRQFSEAVSHLLVAAKMYGKSYSLWTLLGHCYYKLHNYDNCIECFEYVTALCNRPNDIHLINIRMGRYYLKTKKYKCAKKSFLSACKYSPSAETWLGVGVACYNLTEFEEAEAALMEANYLDELLPLVWAYLTLVNIHLKRFDAVGLCYAEAKKNNLTDSRLIAEIENLMEVHGLQN